MDCQTTAIVLLKLAHYARECLASDVVISPEHASGLWERSERGSCPPRAQQMVPVVKAKDSMACLRTTLDRNNLLFAFARCQSSLRLKEVFQSAGFQTMIDQVELTAHYPGRQ